MIHGALGGDSVLEQNGEVSGIIDWKNLQINDPAIDFAWLAPSTDHELLDAVVLNYQLAKSGADASIAKRAVLYSELELAKWLLHGYQRRNPEIIEDAAGMLQDLAEQDLMPLTAAAPVVASSWSLADESAGEVDDNTKPIPTQEELF